MASTDSLTAASKDDLSQPINMTFDELFSSLPRIRGGAVYMAMPHGADLSTARLVTNFLVPMGVEILVDNETVFLYAKPEDLDATAYLALSSKQQEAVLEVIERHHVVLRAFLSIYTCRGFRLWESTRFSVLNNSGSAGDEGQDGDGGRAK